jgi:pimeloyl-ACP methyl ester carboxylesterase
MGTHRKDVTDPTTVEAVTFGTVTTLPDLPADFTNQFTSQYCPVDGVRLHVVTGGTGPPLMLVGGWPQFWWQWRKIMPRLAAHFSVVVIDPRGLGASDKPEAGYDTGTAAADLLGVMDQLGHHRFSLVGHDVGMWLSYAAAADAPERISRLVLMEANLPGISPPPSALPDDNRGIDRLWHFMFNRLPEVNERLVEGREDIYFGNQFAVKGATPTAMPVASVEVYLRALRQPGALHAAFHYYRALEATIKQNRERARRKPLQMPVLAVGGGEHRAETVAADVRAIARDVTPLTIDGCGHYVAEEAPTEILAAMLKFLLD